MNIYKKHLEEMETCKVHNFWKALSSSQKKCLNEEIKYVEIQDFKDKVSK